MKKRNETFVDPLSCDVRRLGVQADVRTEDGLVSHAMEPVESRLSQYISFIIHLPPDVSHP